MFRIKALQKQKGKRLQPNKVIQKAINNLHNIKSGNYDSRPDGFKRRNLTELWLILKHRVVDGFLRIEKVQIDANSRTRSHIKNATTNKWRLRHTLEIGELVLVLAKRLKKKYFPKRLYKSIRNT